MLARIARRDAMASLAGLIADEQRSASLADRSRNLAKGYAERAKVDSGETLARHRAFAAELTGLARQADQARGDASRQADWQVDALAKVEQRIKRLDEHAKLARLQQCNTQERLERADQPTMARRLQKHDPNRSLSDRTRKS